MRIGECPKCHVEVGGRADQMCERCHAIEVARVHQRDTPTVPDVPVKDYQPPPHRFRRPNSDGRRVFRNEKAIQ